MLLTNPVPTLLGLMALLEDGGEKGGVFVDQSLCHAYLEGVANAVTAIGMLGSRMEAAGLLDPFTELSAAPRTPVERRQLARLAAPLDPDGRVVRLPTAGTREVAR